MRKMRRRVVNSYIQVVLLVVLAASFDAATGPNISADAYYVFPVALAGWRFGKRAGMGTIAAALLLNFLVEWGWHGRSLSKYLALDFGLRFIVLSMVYLLSDQVSRQQRSIRAQRDELARLNGRMEEEMQNARSIQQILVGPLPKHPAIELGSYQRTARILGGDSIHISVTPRGDLAILVGDVSGKGSPAALAGAVMIGLFEEMAVRRDSPGLVLENLNRQLSGCLPEDMFVTAFYALLDLQSGKMTFANAGHDWPILFRASGEPLNLSTTGTPLGMFRDTAYEDRTLVMLPGDLLFCYTDGAIDQHQADNERLGIERLRQKVEDRSHLPGSELALALGTELCVEGRDIDDDITLFFARYLGGTR